MNLESFILQNIFPIALLAALLGMTVGLML